MANDLDELDGPVNENGLDVNVIQKKILVTVGIEAKIFEAIVYVSGFAIAGLVTMLSTSLSEVALIMLWIGSPIPGGLYFWVKLKANAYLQQLEQEVQAKASTIDNYLEQRVVILNNVVGIVSKAIDLDKDVMKSVAALRSGIANEGERGAFTTKIDSTFNSLIPRIESYPDLKAHASIADAMKQNSYLQKEVTAARELYNDTVRMWNVTIFEWPVKRIVAAKRQCQTRIPFSISKETKSAARSTFF